MAEDPETTQRPGRAPRRTVIVLGVVLLAALLTLLVVWPKLASSNRSEPQPVGSQSTQTRTPSP